MRRSLAAGLLVVLGSSVVLVGCSDDEPDDASTSGATDAPTAEPTKRSEAAGVVADEVATLAPVLEGFYRSRDAYPTSLDEAVASITPAGVTLSPGTTVGGYTYDEEAVEFVMCLETADGVWASYDTAPMSVQQSGDTGGCPEG